MNIPDDILLFSDEYSYLCFRHAVKLSIEGINIKMRLESFNDYYMGDTYCKLCEKESEKR